MAEALEEALELLSLLTVTLISFEQNWISVLDKVIFQHLLRSGCKIFLSASIFLIQKFLKGSL